MAIRPKKCVAYGMNSWMSKDTGKDDSGLGQKVSPFIGVYLAIGVDFSPVAAADENHCLSKQCYTEHQTALLQQRPGSKDSSWFEICITVAAYINS